MRGKPGTKVKLTIRRLNEKPFDVTLKREEIKTQSVKSDIKDDVLVKMRKMRINKISAQNVRTRDFSDVADFNGNIIGHADSSGNILNSNGTRIGSVSNGVAYDNSGRVIGQLI